MTQKWRDCYNHVTLAKVEQLRSIRVESTIQTGVPRCGPCWLRAELCPRTVRFTFVSKATLVRNTWSVTSRCSNFPGPPASKWLAIGIGVDQRAGGS